MPYEPKYKTGYTCEANGEGEGFYKKGEIVIVVGRWKTLAIYTNWNEKNPPPYDESDAEHTIYGTYCIDRNEFWWYWEKDLDLCCSNPQRGNKILLENFEYVCNEYSIKKAEDFKRSLLT